MNPWMTAEEGRAYCGCKTVKAFYEWRKRHHIITHGRLVARADLDRAIKEQKAKPRKMAAASLENLKLRRHPPLRRTA